MKITRKGYEYSLIEGLSNGNHIFVYDNSGTIFSFPFYECHIVMKEEVKTKKGGK